MVEALGTSDLKKFSDLAEITHAGSYGCIMGTYHAAGGFLPVSPRYDSFCPRGHISLTACPRELRLVAFDRETSGLQKRSSKISRKKSRRREKIPPKLFARELHLLVDRGRRYRSHGWIALVMRIILKKKIKKFVYS